MTLLSMTLTAAASAVVMLLSMTSQHMASSAPVLDNINGLACSIIPQPSLNILKTFSCLLEKDILELLKDDSIPTMANTNEVQECNCQAKSYLFKYAHSPSHGVAPHVRIGQYYKPYQTYNFPENTVDLNNNQIPLTTEWILKDYLNSLNAFVKYFAQSSLTGSALKHIITEVNSSLLNGGFNFSSECPSNSKAANFSGLVNDTCELKCATWHFNDTISDFNHVLTNQHIYKSKTPYGFISDSDWWNAKCCPLLTEANTLTPSAYSSLTCNVQKLNYESYTLFQHLGQSATTDCKDVSTVAGIKTWTSYYNESFPPTPSCSFTEKLFIYGNHFDAFEKYSNDLSALIGDTTFNCFSPLTKDTLLTIKSKLDSTLPQSKQWMKGHGCPYCADLSCAVPDSDKPILNEIQLHETCPNMDREVSCLALDIQKVATSLYMFLELRDDAKESWNIDCDQN